MSDIVRNRILLICGLVFIVCGTQWVVQVFFPPRPFVRSMDQRRLDVEIVFGSAPSKVISDFTELLRVAGMNTTCHKNYTKGDTIGKEWKSEIEPGVFYIVTLEIGPKDDERFRRVRFVAEHVSFIAPLNSFQFKALQDIRSRGQEFLAQLHDSDEPPRNFARNYRTSKPFNERNSDLRILRECN